MQGQPENQIDELLQQWQQRRQLNDTPSVEELCHDHPDLIEAVRQRLASLPPSSDRSSSDTTTVRESMLPKMGADEQESVSVDGYAILDRLSHGGMGIVWKAKQLATDR